MWINVEADKNIVDECSAQLDREAEALTRTRETFERALAPVLSRVQTLPSWGHVRAVSVMGYQTMLNLTLYLASNQKDSPLPREVAQEFHATGNKSAGENALSVSYHLEGEVFLCIEGYLPATCRLERAEEYIPGHVGYVNKVVCTGGEGEEVTPPEPAPSPEVPC